MKEIFKDKKVKVYLFGSRARGENTPRSDLNLGFLSDEDIGYELSLLREILEESNLPFSVDVVDLSKAGREFREMVLKEGKLWISL
ncbi:nucleotidyltransferase family protein [Aquifex aeolicus]|uniref:nucleotidyltransferase family protein n=1 Tax=Aquifex aeolicus TaxID=63363 RepID=UPI002377D679|nr:nucleotidyltransferase domain-containing protein [Aquifex aeolicus]